MKPLRVCPKATPHSGVCVCVKHLCAKFHSDVAFIQVLHVMYVFAAGMAPLLLARPTKL